MKDKYEQDLLTLESWAQSSNEAGWLPSRELDELSRLEKQQAEVQAQPPRTWKSDLYGER